MTNANFALIIIYATVGPRPPLGRRERRRLSVFLSAVRRRCVVGASIVE